MFEGAFLPKTHTMGRPKKIPAVVRAPKYGNITEFSIKKGKEYEIISQTDISFTIQGEYKVITCLFEGCAFLRDVETNRQYEWKIVKTKKP